MKTIITILGYHRSGTSLNAGILTNLGAEAGNNLMEGNAFNAKGYFENNDIVQANDAYLAGIGLKWDHIGEISSENFETQAAHELSLRYDTIFQSQYNQTAEHYIFKDPRISRLLPIWKKFLTKNQAKLKYIIAIRNPESCIQSLKSRNDFESDKVLMHWWRTYSDIAKNIQTDRSERLFIDYDDLLSTPHDTLNKIIEFTEIKPTPQQLESALNFISRDLNHAKPKHQLPTVFTQVYSALKKGDLSSINLTNTLMGVINFAHEASTQNANLIQSKDEHITKQLTHIASLENTVASRDSHIASLENTVASRDSHIASLENTVASRDSHIASLENAAVDAATEIKRLRNLLYSASFDRHLHRALRVLLNDPHYRQ